MDSTDESDKHPDVPKAKTTEAIPHLVMNLVSSDWEYVGPEAFAGIIKAAVRDTEEEALDVVAGFLTSFFPMEFRSKAELEDLDAEPPAFAAVFLKAVKVAAGDISCGCDAVRADVLAKIGRLAKNRS